MVYLCRLLYLIVLPVFQFSILIIMAIIALNIQLFVICSLSIPLPDYKNRHKVNIKELVLSRRELLSFLILLRRIWQGSGFHSCTIITMEIRLFFIFLKKKKETYLHPSFFHLQKKNAVKMCSTDH